MQTLSQAIFPETIKNKNDLAAKRLVLREETVLLELTAMLEERQGRATQQSCRPMLTEQRLQPVPLLGKEAPVAVSTSNAAASTNQDKDAGDDDPLQGDKEISEKTTAQQRRIGAGRDAGVSDTV